MTNLLQWLSGGSHHYLTAEGCLGGDWMTISIRNVLCIGILVGYAIIAIRWFRAAARLPPCPERTSLRLLMHMFYLCGICGYASVVVTTFWPPWRVVCFFLAALFWVTWQYALNSRYITIVFDSIAREQIAKQELAAAYQRIAAITAAKPTE